MTHDEQKGQQLYLQWKAPVGHNLVTKEATKGSPGGRSSIKRTNFQKCQQQQEQWGPGPYK
jgi:hypothetical protein